jgi:hypothetical protein
MIMVLPVVFPIKKSGKGFSISEQGVTFQRHSFLLSMLEKRKFMENKYSALLLHWKQKFWIMML